MNSSHCSAFVSFNLSTRRSIRTPDSFRTSDFHFTTLVLTRNQYGIPLKAFVYINMFSRCTGSVSSLSGDPETLPIPVPRTDAGAYIVGEDNCQRTLRSSSTMSCSSASTAPWSSAPLTRSAPRCALSMISVHETSVVTATGSCLLPTIASRIRGRPANPTLIAGPVAVYARFPGRHDVEVDRFRAGTDPSNPVRRPRPRARQGNCQTISTRSGSPSRPKRFYAPRAFAAVPVAERAATASDRVLPDSCHLSQPSRSGIAGEEL